MNRLCVAVGVSDYGPTLDELPGAARGAEKIREWADEAGYRTLLVTDKDIPVTAGRLKSELQPILEGAEFERVIFYFAGHGTIASAADEKWLLSWAVDDPDEAIDRMTFLRQLAKFHVKQVALLIDACRSQSMMGLNVHGRGVLKNSGADPKTPQMDIFLAASLGDPAFHVQHPGTGEFYCVFTETLLQGLYGRDERAIERDHPEAPAVVSATLANFLEAEVSERAAQLDKKADPEIHADFRRPNDVYLKLPKEAPRELPLGAQQPAATPEAPPFDIAPPSARAGEAAIRETLERIVPEMLKATVLGGDQRPFSAIRERSSRLGLETLPLVAWNGRAREIATSDPAPRFADDAMRITVVHTMQSSANVFVKTEKGNWCFVPLYRNLLNLVSIGPRLLDVMNFVDLSAPYAVEREYRDVLAPLVTGDLRAADANWLADNVRYLKHRSPLMGVIAAYLYAAKGDFDNIARMANYYFFEQQPVPFDIALLGAERIRWERDRELGFRVEADFPKVDRVEANSATDLRRPWFTREGFEARGNVPVAGFMPWMTQGWSLFERERGKEIPELLLDVSSGASPGTFAGLVEKAGDFLIRELGFHRVSVAEAGEGVAVEAV